MCDTNYCNDVLHLVIMMRVHLACLGVLFMVCANMPARAFFDIGIISIVLPKGNKQITMFLLGATAFDVINVCAADAH